MTILYSIHIHRPTRRDAAPRARYSLYREELREDFFEACGYCGDTDERADRSTFHIDHFAPKKRFSHLEIVYTNLVYACRFCNISKSDHWIGDDPTISHDGERGFVDPCSEEYDLHLGRDKSGRIKSKSDLGKYIINKLNLHLIRHELMWRARRARALRDEIESLIEEFKTRDHPLPDYAPLLDRFFELTKSIDDYELRAVPR